jgi:xylose isomerase
MQNSAAMPRFGAGLWHFGQFRDRYATDGYGPAISTLQAIKIAGSVGGLSVVDLNYPFSPAETSVGEVSEALAAAGLGAIALTPEIYTGRFGHGGFTNPDETLRRAAIELVSRSAEAARTLGCEYVKIWPGQDGWDYPFQADYRQLWRYSVEAMRELAQRHPDLRFAIEYKPREPRNRMTFSSMARTLLAIEDMNIDNVGVLLDFGHSLYGGESPAEAAQMAIDRGRLYAIDVNDNFRGWDDDMVVGSVHLIETLEFFQTLHSNGWTGVWQLDQFPFREDAADAARAGIEVMKIFWRALRHIDAEQLRAAQNSQDALAAQRTVRRALLSAGAGAE